MTDPVKIIVGEGSITEVNVPEYNLIQTGGGGGGGGSDGATFFPEVSEEGVISWTNDGGYDNPEPVNIKGPAGNDGNDGEDGEDGVSPTVTFTTITGGHTMTVTDKDHPSGQSINIMDGTSGGGGTSDYDDLTDKPSINGTTLSGNKTAAELGLAAASDIPTVPVQSVNGKTGAVVLSASDVGAGTYSKPSGGIPKSDLASAVQNKLDKTVVVSDTQPTATENKLWVDTDAGAGSSYQVPTVAEMEAADNTILGNLAMIESSPATAAHAVGEYIVLNGHLYKVTAAIAAGQTLTIGTNIEAITVASAISSLSNLEQFSATYNQDYTSDGNVFCYRIGKICFIEGNFSLTQNVPTWTDVNLLTMSIDSAIRVYSYAFGNSTTLRSLQLDPNSNIVKLRSLNSAITPEGFRFGMVFISQ